MTYKSDPPNPIDDGLSSRGYDPESSTRGNPERSTRGNPESSTRGLTPAEKTWLRQIPESDLSREIAYLKAMEIRLVTLLANLEDTEEPARVEYLRALAASALKISRLTRALIDRSQAPNDPIPEPRSSDQNKHTEVG